jgi:peptide/nickel transport system ATP-binding protein
MLLEISNLVIELPTSTGSRRVVSDLSFSLDRGQSLGIVGESGSGKTITALAVMRLLPERAMVSGRIAFEQRDLTHASEREMQAVRGNRIAMIFQEPMTALNPLHSIGRQVAEPLILHRGLSKSAAWSEAVRLLDRVKLREFKAKARAYPFELSGGERQRAMIAMALSCTPSLLIADEPTTALDVTVQARILDLLRDLGSQSNMAMILVSHDLAVIAQNCAWVLVMYGGSIMESGPVGAVLESASHPYTRALLAARPRPGAPRGERLMAISGNAPGAGAGSNGCPFAGRCPEVRQICREAPPPVVRFAVGREARCHRIDSEGRLT